MHVLTRQFFPVWKRFRVRIVCHHVVVLFHNLRLLLKHILNMFAVCRWFLSSKIRVRLWKYPVGYDEVEKIDVCE